MDYLSPEEFKKKVLELKSQEVQDNLTNESIKMEAIRVCSIFPELFGDDLDRMTLWDRIGSAIQTSIVKSNNDLSVFVNSCLEHIKAEAGKVACHEELRDWLDSNNAKSKEWVVGFFHYVSTRYFLVIAKARQEWEIKKQHRAMERKGGQNGN